MKDRAGMKERKEQSQIHKSSTPAARIHPRGRRSIGIIPTEIFNQQKRHSVSHKQEKRSKSEDRKRASAAGQQIEMRTRQSLASTHRQKRQTSESQQTRQEELVQQFRERGKSDAASLLLSEEEKRQLALEQLAAFRQQFLTRNSFSGGSAEKSGTPAQEFTEELQRRHSQGVFLSKSQQLSLSTSFRKFLVKCRRLTTWRSRTQSQ